MQRDALVIKDISLKRVEIALKSPFVTALRRVESVVFVRVTVLFDDLSISMGEAPATKAITGEGIEDITESIVSIRELLIGCGIERALKVLHKQKIGSSAKAALDMALYLKKEYFAREYDALVQTDITISLADSQQMLESAQRALLSGCDILKIKLGSDIFHAVEVTQRLSKELPKAKLLIDANQAWSVESTLYYLREIQNCTIELIEQPIKADDLHGLKTITDNSSIPILADEAVFSFEDVKYVVQKGCADMINIKLMKCGGLSKAVEILEYARKANVQCMLGSMLEGPYSINAAIYLAFAYRDVVKYVDLDSPLLYKELPEELDFTYEANSIRFKQQVSR